MWQGLHEITDDKNKNSHIMDTDVTLPDKLHTFFASFEDNTVPPSRLANKDKSWDREIEKQLLSQGHQIAKQQSLRQRGCCPH
jgi:hypothetical protein